MTSPTTPTFRKAARHAVKARIALAGPSGSGKTYTGLVLATSLAGEGRVAVLDTEKGSSELYADEFDFDVMHLDPPFSPERYVAGIQAAVEAGYTAILIDSLSHAWADEGGVLDIVDQEAVRTQGNKFAAWRKGTPEQQKLLGGLIRSPIHTIVTMRSKQDYAVDTDDRGRTRVRKLGLAPIQREGVEYEFSVFGELDLDHTLSISKSRYASLQDLVIKKPGTDFAQQVLKEVEVGEPEATEETIVVEDTPAENLGQKASQAQITALHSIAGNLGWSDEEKHRRAGVSSLKSLYKDRASALIEEWGRLVEGGSGEEKASAEGEGLADSGVNQGSDSSTGDPERTELWAKVVKAYGRKAYALKAAHEKFGVAVESSVTVEQMRELLADKEGSKA